MILKIFASGPLDTNAYVLACEKTKKAWVIDAPLSSSNDIIKFLNQNALVCDKIILTHSHWDHIADVAHLKKELHCPIAVHQKDLGNLLCPGSDGLPLYFPIEGAAAEEILEGGEILTLGDLTALILHTPGHSEGSICLYFKEQRCLISGDTLFQGSMGRVDLPGSDPDKMWSSLKLLADLPLDTIVYPGHGGATHIGKESWMGRAKELFS